MTVKFLNRRQMYLSHAYEKDQVASRIELAGLWAGRRRARRSSAADFIPTWVMFGQAARL